MIVYLKMRFSNFQPLVVFIEASASAIESLKVLDSGDTNTLLIEE